MRRTSTRGRASIGALLGPPDGAPPKPEPRPCRSCGTLLEAAWLGRIHRRFGWVHPEFCQSCSEKAQRRARAARQQAEKIARLEQRIRRARLTPQRQGCTFDTFRPRPGLELPLRAAQDFATAMLTKPWPPRGLFFVGPNGTGKSHLALAILNAAMRPSQLTGLFVELADFLAALRTSFGSAAGRDTDELRTMMWDVDLLVLDDVGAANIPENERGDWMREEITRLLNHREAQGRPLILTADAGRDVLSARLGVRIVSRIYGACRIVPFPNVPDYRMHREEREQ